MADGNGAERERLYNWLRKWSAISLITSAIGLAIFDGWDDIALGNLYAGCPVWLSGIVAAIVGSLFAEGVIRAVKK